LHRGRGSGDRLREGTWRKKGLSPLLMVSGFSATTAKLTGPREGGKKLPKKGLRGGEGWEKGGGETVWESLSPLVGCEWKFYLVGGSPLQVKEKGLRRRKKRAIWHRDSLFVGHYKGVRQESRS